jgi:hypothetical protein
MTGVDFHKTIVAADQYETERGAEIAYRAGTKRRTRKRARRPAR